MKAVALTSLRKLEIIEKTTPQIVDDTDVLIKIKSVGICGSDVHYYETGQIGSQVVEYPYLIGHECAGIVEQVGSAVKDLKPGDRIAVEPARSCYNCDQCKIERFHTCRNLLFLGTPGQGDGCMCEYIVMPQQCCFKIAESVTFEQAVLAEPFAIGCYTVVVQGRLEPKEKTLILGAGPIGLSCMVAAKIAGTDNIYMTEKIPERIKTASENGAKWVGNPDSQDIIAELSKLEPAGIDIAFECAGWQETIDQAVEALRPGGKLVLVGIPRESRVSFSIDKLRRKEITVINVRRQNECTQKAVDLISSGQANLDFMITHKFAIEQATEGFELVAGYKDGVIKAFINF